MADWLKDSGVFVHTLLPAVNGGLPVGLDVEWSNDEQAEFRALVAGVARGERLQVLHAHYGVPFAHVAASLARGLGESGPVTVATLHGTDVSIHGRQPGQRRLLSESLRALTAVSHRLTRPRRPRAPSLRPARTALGDPELHRRQPIQADAVPHRDRPRIVHVSNFRRVKDPRSLAQVFLAVRERIDAELWLIGDGPTLPALREMLSEAGAGDAVRSLGATADVAPILRETDLLLMTSVAESFCVAAAEAMACGIPVVAHPGGWSRRGGRRWNDRPPFPVGAHAAIADAVVELLSRPRLRRRAGSAARRQAARFACERIVPLYERLYRDLVDRAERDGRAADAVAEART